MLVLEDEPIISMVLEDGLLDLGARPAMAGTIEQAEQLLASGRQFEAAILDVNIHGEESYGFARGLVAMGVPFVFASGYGNTSPPELAHVPVFTKPYDLAAIAAAIIGISPPTPA